LARKKKVTTEIVGYDPPSDHSKDSQTPSEKALALKQKNVQLESMQKDLEQFLPVVQNSRQTLVELFFEAMKQAVENEDFKNQMIQWILKHPKDATAAISTLNAVANTVTQPEQLRSGGRKRIRLMFSKNQGVEITE